jgi:hypothetical protein
MGMSETGTDTIVRVSRAARRLGRLFKIERAGGFDRRPLATVRRLIERRGTLVEELLLLGGMRSRLAAPRSAELEQALGELAREVNQSLHPAERKVDHLGGDLRLRSREGLPTGIRNGASGRLLGES